MSDLCYLRKPRMFILTGGSALYHTTSTGVTGTHAGLPEPVVDWCSLKQSRTPVYQQLNT